MVDELPESPPDAAALAAVFDAMQPLHHPASFGPVRRADALLVAACGGELEAVERGRTTALEIARLKLDMASIVAALLVRPIADGLLGPEQLRAGLADETSAPPELTVAAEVGAIAEGLQRIATVHWSHLEEESAERLRKMFLAMAADVRVVLVALADRVQTLRELDARPAAERAAIAAEALSVFAPLANRLGVWQLKWEIEDLALRQIEPDTYREVKRQLAAKRSERLGLVDKVMGVLRDELARAGIAGKVTGRPKHIYSIVKKMRRKGVGFEEVYDVTAVRVIVEEVRECYAVLGIVHELYEPIPGEFDDYIAKPKDNFYRSLHTAVVGPGGYSLEVQIRTWEMHDFAEYGVAAHWRYKEGGKGSRALDAKIDFLRQLMEWQREITDPHEIADSLRTDVFQDQIYVFTPTGDVVDLPRDATPVDFAYRIHTMVGHRCVGAKVNGAIVPLDTALQTGDRIEILTQKQPRPSRDWLSPHLGYTRTAGARQKIRHWFRQQGREQAIADGRELVERELKRVGLAHTKLDDVAALYEARSVDDLLAGVGHGDVSPASVASRVLELEAPKAPPPLPPPVAPAHHGKPKGVRLAGIGDVLSQSARCCNPVPGDEVIGFVTRGRGVVIHRVDCPNVRNTPEPERLVALDWGGGQRTTFPVDVHIEAHDRAGLLRDIAEVIANEGLNLRAAQVDARGKSDIAIARLTIDVRESEQLVRVLAKLERLPYVVSAARVRR